MNIRICVITTLLLWAALFTQVESPRAWAAAEPLLIVAALAFPTTDISFADLKSAFRGEGAQIGGKRLIPINHPLDSALRVAFDRKVLGLEPAAVGRFWVDRRIRDEGKPPTTAPSPDLAVRIAASLNGAITYATKAWLNPKLKVLTVDGKAAGQSGYPLQL